MDIVNPAAPAIPRHEMTPGQAAVEDAENELHKYKVLAKEVKEEAYTLYKAAKDLVKEVIYQREHGKEEVTRGAWSNEEYDQSRKNLAQKQEKPWEVLKTKAEALAQKIEGPYKLVTYAQEHVYRARGDRINAGIFGTLSNDQKEVRKIYDNKLKFKFDEAAAAHSELVSYPDGLLTQVHLLHKRAKDNEGVYQREKGEKQGNLYLAAHQQKV